LTPATIIDPRNNHRPPQQSTPQQPINPDPNDGSRHVNNASLLHHGCGCIAVAHLDDSQQPSGKSPTKTTMARHMYTRMPHAILATIRRCRSTYGWRAPQRETSLLLPQRGRQARGPRTPAALREKSRSNFQSTLKHVSWGDRRRPCTRKLQPRRRQRPP